MSIETAIARFRTRQADQFTTTATVNRPIGEPVFDPQTGDVTQDYELTFSGGCKIRPDSTRSTAEVDAGETSVALPDFNAKFPVDTDIQRGDVVLVTASRHDAGMVGKTYTVAMAQNDEWQIARVAILDQTVVPLLNIDEEES